MRRFAVGLLAVMVWMAVPAPVHALESPLDAIPDSAGMVIRLKNSQETTNKLIKFANEVDPGLAFLLETGLQGIGVLISNPSLEGVDREADWWVAVFPAADAEPGVVFGIPATDAEKLEASVGAGFHFAKEDKWVFYSEQEEALKHIQDKLAGEGKSISTLIDAESRAVMDRGDLSVFVNLVQLKEIYDERIESTQQQAAALLEQLKILTAQTSGADSDAVFEMYGKLLEAVVQGVEDAQSATAGLAVGESSLDLEKYLSFAADSDSAKRLEEHTPSTIPLVTKLPPGQLGYFGFQGDMQGLIQFGLGYSAAMFADDEDVQKKWDELQKKMGELHYGGYAGSLGIGDAETGALRADIVTEVKPTDKFREISREAVALMKDVEQQGIKQTVALQPDAEKYGERSADVLTFKQEFDEALDPTGMQRKMLELMFGPNGLTERIVYLDDKVAQTMGGGPEAMEALLKSLADEGGEADAATANAELRDTRSRLAETANLLGFVDLPNVAVKGAILVKQSGQMELPVELETLKRLDIERSYLGVSVTAEPHAVRTKVDIPAAQLTGALKLATFVQSMRARQQPGEEVSP